MPFFGMIWLLFKGTKNGHSICVICLCTPGDMLRKRSQHLFNSEKMIVTLCHVSTLACASPQTWSLVIIIMRYSVFFGFLLLHVLFPYCFDHSQQMYFPLCTAFIFSQTGYCIHLFNVFTFFLFVWVLIDLCFHRINVFTFFLFLLVLTCEQQSFLFYYFHCLFCCFWFDFFLVIIWH